MRPTSEWPDRYRDQTDPRYVSKPGDEFGKFRIRSDDPRERHLCVIATANFGEIRWDHVSVSSYAFNGRKEIPVMPTWDEMCQVKDLFWGYEETVIQYHPPRSQYVNHKANVLHLWCHADNPIPTPNPILVGPLKDLKK